MWKWHRQRGKRRTMLHRIIPFAQKLNTSWLLCNCFPSTVYSLWPSQYSLMAVLVFSNFFCKTVLLRDSKKHTACGVACRRSPLPSAGSGPVWGGVPPSCPGWPSEPGLGGTPPPDKTRGRTRDKTMGVPPCEQTNKLKHYLHVVLRTRAVIVALKMKIYRTRSLPKALDSSISSLIFFLI